MADELNEIYAYCEKTLKEYLESKNPEKLREIETIIGGIADSWSKIGD